MASFTDSKGTKWNLDITIEAMKRVKTACGIDLGNIHQGSPPQSAVLDTDVVLLFDVIYMVIRPQADSRGISDVEFGESLGGDSALAAREAFWRSLIDFFQRFRRTDAVAALTKQMALVDRVIQLATAEIDRLQIDETAAEIQQTFGRRSIDGQASSVSTPAL